MAQTMGIPSLLHGDGERVRGVPGRAQREVCPAAFQNLCLTLCVCASQLKKKKYSHHQILDSQLL